MGVMKEDAKRTDRLLENAPRIEDEEHTVKETVGLLSDNDCGKNEGQMDSSEISLDQFAKLSSADYLLLDMRESSAYHHGHIPGAVNCPLGAAEKYAVEHQTEKQIILYCAKGLVSVEMATNLQAKGIKAYSLSGGYTGWLLEDLETKKEKEIHLEVEQSIRKKFHRALFSKFAKAINEYELLQEGDKVAVCISGGKDSIVMAKLFQELRRHNKFPFETIFLIMDPGYSPENRAIVEKNCERLQIPYILFETNIFDSVFQVEKSPCYLCARMRRGYLYSKAKELGCNKIALGHHYDDVIETILMGMLYGAQVQTMMPKLHSTNFPGMELIRPMYLIREDDIKHWRDYNNLYFIQCACRFTDTCNTCNPDGTTGSKRLEVKQLIAQMKEKNPFVESNIFRSMENVNIDTVIAYKEKGVRHHFLKDY